MDVNVCFSRITGHMKRLTCGWVIMVISSPCTSTNTSPDFRPALYAGVSIPRTFSTCTTFEHFYVGIRRFNVFMLKYDPATFITVATSAPPTILRPHGLFPSLWISRSTTCRRHIWNVIQLFFLDLQNKKLSVIFIWKTNMRWCLPLATWCTLFYIKFSIPLRFCLNKKRKNN